MTLPNQTEMVEAHVDDALARGARALTGGSGSRSRRLLRADRAGRRRPLDDDDARRDLRPVVRVMKVRDPDEALRLANDTPYGLAASVFGDKERPSSWPTASTPARSTSTTSSSTSSRHRACPRAAGSESGMGGRLGEYGIKKYCRAGVDRRHPLRRQARADLVPVHQGPPGPRRPGLPGGQRAGYQAAAGVAPVGTEALWRWGESVPAPP